MPHGPFPDDLRVHVWNIKLVQMGPTGGAKMEEIKETMDLTERSDLLSFADMIEVDEGRL